MRFLDTNIFLRFLINDDPIRSPACRDLFQRIEDGEEATTSETIVAEIFYVLTREKGRYRVDRNELVEQLRPLLVARGMRFGDRGVILRALDVYAAHSFLDFEDALNIAHFEIDGLEAVVSYDGGLSKVPGVVRIEP